MKSDLDVGVRDCIEGDLDPLAQIRSDHFLAIADARGGGLITETDQARHGEDHRHRLFQATANSDCELVVGTLDGYPLGYGLLSVTTLGPGRHLGTVEELLVEPGARQVSLGETMMNELVDRSLARGCFGIDSRALPGDRETKNFFESFGLKARLLVVHRDLSQQP